MRMKTLGGTGLVVSEVCLGTMTFGGGEGIWASIGTLQQKEATELIGAAVARGVNFFDTADVYSAGRSETVTGQAFRDLRIPRDQFVLATKVCGRMGPGKNEAGLSRAHVLSGVDASLKRLELDYIDLYQIHAWDPLTPLEETLDALDDCVRAGKVRYIGLSNHAAWQITKSLWISDKKQLARFESVQAYYSLAGRDLEREIVPLAKDQKLAILPWSPLAGGMLSGKFSRNNKDPDGARRSTFDFPPVDREKVYAIVDVLKPIAQSHDSSVARVALAWLLHQAHVTSVIIGAKTRAQLDDNLAAVDVKLSASDLEAINKVSALTPEYPGWMLERMSQDRLASVK